MMHLCAISKSAPGGSAVFRPVFHDLTASIPTDRHVALLGDDQPILSLLLRIMAGWDTPDSGHVVTSRARLSPIINSSGPAGTFLARMLSGRDNIRFVARAYGADEADLTALVRRSCGSGISLDEPIAGLDRPIRQAFELALAPALPNDCYLIDRMQDLTPQQRRQMSNLARRRGSGMIFTTTSPRLAAIFADRVAIIRHNDVLLLDPAQHRESDP